jgi:hypothetical protein
VSGATIKRVEVAAAHDGDAELIVVLCFENGGESLVALDEYAARALLACCDAQTPEDLVGAGWEHVRDALVASSNRYVKTTE